MTQGYLVAFFQTLYVRAINASTLEGDFGSVCSPKMVFQLVKTTPEAHLGVDASVALISKVLKKAAMYPCVKFDQY